MRLRLLVGAALAVHLVFVLPTAATEVPTCALSNPDRAWLEKSLESWNAVSSGDLHLTSPAPPWIVAFDGRCAYHINPDMQALRKWPARNRSTGRVTAQGEVVAVVGIEHGGAIRLPDGQQIPPEVMTFSATWGSPIRPFLTMAMPAVWRATPRHADNPRLDVLIRSVFVHEMTHTRQASAMNERIEALRRELALPGEMNDDVVQDRFEKRPGVREAYERELDLFYKAASAKGDDASRKLASEAFTAMKARRGASYTGKDAPYAELEDLFLEMEGLANWAGVRSAVRQGLSFDEAVSLMRGGKKHWSQDEGLAIILVLDRLQPGWQARMFELRQPSLEELLSRATAISR